MTARDRRSKKQSASSSKRLDPSRLTGLVFFLDHNLGRYAIAKVLRAAGAEVEIHDDHFQPGTADIDWLSKVGQRGWVVLSKDAAIKRREHELNALRQAGVRAFFLTSANLTGRDMAEVFVKALPKIVQHATNTPAPFVYTITKRGEISRVV